MKWPASISDETKKAAAEFQSLNEQASKHWRVRQSGEFDWGWTEGTDSDAAVRLREVVVAAVNRLQEEGLLPQYAEVLIRAFGPAITAREIAGMKRLALRAVFSPRSTFGPAPKRDDSVDAWLMNMGQRSVLTNRSAHAAFEQLGDSDKRRAVEKMLEGGESLSAVQRQWLLEYLRGHR